MAATLTGLVKRQELNGRRVQIVRFNPSSTRYTVELVEEKDADGTLAIKPNNLIFDNGTRIEILDFVQREYNIGSKEAVIVKFNNNEDGMYSVKLLDNDDVIINLKPEHFIADFSIYHQKKTTIDTGLKSLAPPTKKGESPPTSNKKPSEIQQHHSKKMKVEDNPTDVPWQLENEEAISKSSQQVESLKRSKSKNRKAKKSSTKDTTDEALTPQQVALLGASKQRAKERKGLLLATAAAQDEEKEEISSNNIYPGATAVPGTNSFSTNTNRQEDSAIAQPPSLHYDEQINVADSSENAVVANVVDDEELAASIARQVRQELLDNTVQATGVQVAVNDTEIKGDSSQQEQTKNNNRKWKMVAIICVVLLVAVIVAVVVALVVVGGNASSDEDSDPSTTSATSSVTAVAILSGATGTLNNDDQFTYKDVQRSAIARETGISEDSISVEITGQSFEENQRKRFLRQEVLPPPYRNKERHLQDSSPSCSITSFFESDSEEWTIFGDAEVSYSKSGGNPDGYIFATDRQANVAWYFQAPPKFHGNFSGAYGHTLSFDLLQNKRQNQFDARDVIIEGKDRLIWFDTTMNPGLDWTSYSVILDNVNNNGGSWSLDDNTVASEDDIRAVLSNINSLQIRGEYEKFADTGQLDNVVLSLDKGDCTGTLAITTVTTFENAPIALDTSLAVKSALTSFADDLIAEGITIASVLSVSIIAGTSVPTPVASAIPNPQPTTKAPVASSPQQTSKAPVVSTPIPTPVRPSLLPTKPPTNAVIHTSLVVLVDGQEINLEVPPLSFNSLGSDNQDVAGVQPQYVVSADGYRLSLYGNSWKAFPLEYTVSSTTVLEFDCTITEKAEFFGICLDVNLNDDDSGVCFITAAYDSSVEGNLLGNPVMGQTKTYRVEVGKYYLGAVKYLAFFSDNDDDRAIGQSTFSDISIYNDPSANPNFVIRVDSENATLNVPPVPFNSLGEDNQDVIGMLPQFAVSSDGSSLSLHGNSWKAFPFDYTISSTTVLEFDFTITEAAEFFGICFDINLVDDDSGVCFITATYDSGVNGNLLGNPVIGQTKTYRVEVGKYYLGAVKYLAFFSDNDDDRTVGQSTFSGVSIYDDPSANPKFVVEINGKNTSLPVPPVSFNSLGDDNQDVIGVLPQFVISSNGNELTLHGNSWKGFLLENAVKVNATTVLEFDFTLTVAGEFHGICLDVNANNDESGVCFILANADDVKGLLFDYTTVGETKHYYIEVGKYLTGGMVQYLAFFNDNDSNRGVGESSFNNVKLYNDPNANPNLIITVDGMKTALQGPAVSYGCCYDSDQDAGFQPQYVVSTDGSQISLNGNAWKAFPFIYTITNTTVLEFDYTLSEVGEFHGICVDKDLNDDGETSGVCFKTADESGVGWNVLDPFTQTGETRQYRVEIGSFFQGDIAYLAFVTDNDANLAVGKATFKNVMLTTTSLR